MSGFLFCSIYLSANSSGERLVLEDANRNDSNIQIIYTSHSPTLASKIDIENINLIYECGHEKFCLPFSEAKLNEDNKKYLQICFSSRDIWMLRNLRCFLQGEFYL